MKGNLANVIAKGPGTMMVLAVYVIGDCPGHGDEAGSRRDWQEPSLGKKYVDNIAESDTALAAHHSGGFVETKNAVEAMTLDQVAACVEARIAVTPAQAKRKQGAGGSGVEDFGYLVIPGRFVYLTVLDLWITAPRENTLRGWRDRRAFRQACRSLSLHINCTRRKLRRGAHTDVTQSQDPYNTGASRSVATTNMMQMVPRPAEFF